MSSRSFLPVLVVISAPFVILACGKPDGVAGATAWEGGQTPQALAVESLVVARGSLTEEIGASGTVAGVREAYVVSETQGIVKSVSFSLGDSVVEGQELLRVDDSIAGLNLDRAKEQYESARLELDATEKLGASGRASPADLTRARGNASGAEAQYKTALKAFNDSRLRAPISGVVASREEVATVGATLAPNVRVARVIDVSSFRITVGVGEREVGLVEQGALVKVYVPAALGEEPVEGRVAAVAAGADTTTGSFPVVVSFRNGFSGRVKSGMSASVSIAARKAEPSIVVPSAALLRRGSDYAVFVDTGGKAEVRTVMPGRRAGVRVEVLSGLKVGEKVIISALTQLRPGVSVTSVERGDTAGWE